MQQLGDDISKFNMAVKSLIQSLYEYGETIQNLLINIKKSYLVYKNKAFCKYISNMFDYFENDKQLVLTPNQLIVQ